MTAGWALLTRSHTDAIIINQQLYRQLLDKKKGKQSQLSFFFG
jgi:hypothetical protein